MAAVALLGLPGLAHAQLGRGEISVGYGVAPVTDWIDAYSDKLLDVLDMKDASMDSWGGVSVNYTFRIVGGLGVGATFVTINIKRRKQIWKSKEKYIMWE